jgi:TetR/AcrR family transcriptional regulator, ethionamide resistance regulator
MASSATVRRTTRRPPHDRAVSEREILDAAEMLLREVPFRELTVERVMARTGLKRTAFYVHFSDRHDLVLRLVQDLGAEFITASRGWLAGGDDPEADLLSGMRGSVATYAAHGRMLRALADAAAVDARVEAAYRGMVETLVDAVTRRIAGEQGNGRIAADLAAAETARALVWMNERYLYGSLGRSPDADQERVVSVLYRIWLAALYGLAAVPAD